MAKRSNQSYKELSIKEFTSAAERYDGSNPGIYATCRKNYDAILTEIEKEPFHDLLDAGCGTGLMTALLSESYPQSHLVGLDLTPKMIEVAQRKKLPNAEFVVGDCENLPFPEASFDAVICLESFHHYPSPEDFFLSAYRVLRKGGRLILQDYAAEGLLKAFANHVEMPLANVCGHGDVGVHTKQELYAMAEKAGFTVESFAKQGMAKMRMVARK